MRGTVFIVFVFGAWDVFSKIIAISQVSHCQFVSRACNAACQQTGCCCGRRTEQQVKKRVPVLPIPNSADTPVIADHLHAIAAAVACCQARAVICT